MIDLKEIKSTLLILSVCGLLFLAGCGLKVGNLDLAKIASTGSRVLSGNQLSLEQQQVIGQQMTAIIVGSSKLHANAKLQKYVNRVGLWVAMQSKQKDAKANNWQFIIIDTPDFNAFSMPGGYIVISSGVIDRLSSESELAAVLAHEIVHVEQKHQVKAIEKDNRWSDVGELAFSAADFQKAQKGGYSDNALKNRQLLKATSAVAQKIYTKGLSRDDELDADAKAVVLMTRAGYDPFAYLSVLQIIESIDNDKKLLMLATHPKVSERLHVAYSALNRVEMYLDKTQAVESRFIKNVP
jgi:beta-barrel assembly-enhancing protease